MVVVARIVDSCGAKRVTFAERGNDMVYNRSFQTDNAQLHETHEAAVDWLKTLRADWDRQAKVIEAAHTDAEDIKSIVQSIRALNPTNE